MTASGREGEARLGVSSQILSDIVLNPGAIDFGTVTRGQSPTQVLTIDRINAPGWKFVRMVSASRAINAQLAETVADGDVGELHADGQPEAGCPDRARARRDPADQQRSGNPEHPGDGDGLDPRRADGGAVGACRWARSIRRPVRKGGSWSGRRGRSRSGRSKGPATGSRPRLPMATRQPMHVVTVAYKPEEGTTRGDIRRVFRVHTDLPGEPPLDLTATLHVDP